jgi:peptidoglycan/xylan/chitin deacetylase (PgdA/CDA1 family)
MTATTTHPYSIVLSHDVDYISLRSFPIFDRVTVSFFKRSLWSNLLRTCKGDISFREYLDSVRWCLLYPFVKLNLVADPWEKGIYQIMAMEREYGVRSTFFFIPIPSYAGKVSKDVDAPKGRAARYDLGKYKELLQRMDADGWEVGVHGLDAHVSLEKAKEEISVLRKIIPGKPIGVRMHYLYQSEELWSNLKEAGYHYDATMGSNNEVGFPDGRYRPFRKDNLWVVPLNIQDGTLLGDWHMGLCLEDAWRQIESILKTAKEKNAVVTVLWHTNIFGVHSYWGNIYRRILERARRDNAQVLRCIDACEECA